MTRVLFLSATSSCRNQMAAAFAEARRKPDVEIVSAGLAAAPIRPSAVAVMAEVGLDIAQRPAIGLDALETGDVDIVITLCKRAAEACPVLPGCMETIDWGVLPPEPVTGDAAAQREAFRNTRDTIKRLVDDFFERGYFSAFKNIREHERMLLDNVSDGIMAHDLDGRIFHFNAAAARITGLKRLDVMHRLCHDVFAGGLCGAHCRFAQGSAPDLEPRTSEIQIVRKDGERRTVAQTISPIVSAAGDTRGLLVTFRDMTREQSLARRVGAIEQFSGIVGRDEKMLEVFDLIRDLADTNMPVLVQGESGTGKELVAVAIHNEGPRANKLFVPVNCGALPEALLESELFGHVKGAFTGAYRDKKGRFELADGGTIFLDEIGDISPVMQVKLLRVLQEGAFERVGDERTIKVDVRVISATNKNLAEEIEAGRFREDLFYRLSVVPIWLPALRERRTDIPLLVRHVLQAALEECGKTGVTLAPETLDVMLTYDWPGNVRELQNWIRFALVRSHGAVIRPEHLPPMGRQPGLQPARSASRVGRRKLDESTVRAALEETGGNKVEAAKVLGVSRATLYRFIDRTQCYTERHK
jgi:sigma-54 dependent transcriptional regulator, acetoin dehydrogenase operon transcriptional activator AcoR